MKRSFTRSDRWEYVEMVLWPAILFAVIVALAAFARLTAGF